jgi:hypothetical protein
MEERIAVVISSMLIVRSDMFVFVSRQRVK